jgi:hypothetical protein
MFRIAVPKHRGVVRADSGAIIYEQNLLSVGLNPTTPDNSPSCMPWCASLTSRLPTLFTTQELYPHNLAKGPRLGTRGLQLACSAYDLCKLRLKALVHKLPRSRRYQLTPQGYSLCLVFLTRFERVYAPLTAGLLRPVPGDRKLQQQRQSQPRPPLSAHRRFSKLSASSSPPELRDENKILVTAPITARPRP